MVSHVFKPRFLNRLICLQQSQGPGVISQLYAFQDKGERDLTLRPELTAPVMRMVAEELRNETKPLRLSYYGQCFRYEEFKKGRYREFYQYGVELIGATGPLVEAEVIALAINMLTEAGLKNWELRIGHVGVLKQVLTGIGLERFVRFRRTPSCISDAFPR